jgi:PIN domain nuclease of toxin-antitoxin system
MKLLLDTHVFIWADGDLQKLSPLARAACEDPANRLYLSSASVWEKQIKLKLGKLTLRKPLRPLLQDWLEHSGLLILSVHLEHVLQLEDLPPHRKDPFDRLLIAQATAENCTIVTRDELFAQYNVPIIW